MLQRHTNHKQYKIRDKSPSKLNHDLRDQTSQFLPQPLGPSLESEEDILSEWYHNKSKMERVYALFTTVSSAATARGTLSVWLSYAIE